MRISKECLNTQIEWLNKMLVNRGVEHTLHIERFNGFTWVKNDIGETIAVGTPLEVYNQIEVVISVMYSVK
nr:MAG TPA: hypothetical protein [Caudoviricetes sp.]